MNEMLNEIEMTKEAMQYDFNNIKEMMRLYMNLAEDAWDVKTDRARDHLDMLQAYIEEFRDMLDAIDDLNEREKEIWEALAK